PAITKLNNAGSTVPVSVTYSAATNTATFDLGGVLADGNYHLTLNAFDVADGVGHHPAADLQFDFFFLLADADHNRTVNTLDFVALAIHFGQSSGVNFGDGDFN